MLREHRIDHEGLQSEGWEEFAQPGAPKMNFRVHGLRSGSRRNLSRVARSADDSTLGSSNPAAVTGAEEEQHRALREAFLVLRRRIELFVALPPEKLTSFGIHEELSRIGTDRHTERARPCPNPRAHSKVSTSNSQFPTADRACPG